MVVVFVSISILVGVFLLATGIFQTLKTPEKFLIQKLSRFGQRAAREGTPGLGDLAVEEEARARVKRGDWLPTVTRLLSSRSWYEKLDADLRSARSPWKANEALVAGLFLCAIVDAIAVFMIRHWVGFLVGLPALTLPWLMVRFFRGKFLIRFESQLGETLLLMSNALRAGYSYMQAVDLVAREALPPIGEEFFIMMQEMTVGIAPDEALLNLSKRVKSSDVDLMVTAVLIQRRVGGALAEILDTLAEVIRDRVRLRGRIRALTAQGRLTGYLLAGLPVGVGVIIHLTSSVFGGVGAGGKSYIAPLFENPIGRYFVVTGIFLQLAGFFVIKKITTIEV